MILDGLPRYFSNKLHPQSLSALLVAPEFSVLSSMVQPVVCDFQSTES